MVVSAPFYILHFTFYTLHSPLASRDESIIAKNPPSQTWRGDVSDHDEENALFHGCHIGRTYGESEHIPISLTNGDLLNYQSLTAKCRSSHGPRTLPRIKTEDWRNIAG